MATNRLLADARTPHGKLLVEAVEHAVSLQASLKRIRNMMGQVVRSQTALLDTDFQPLATELNCSLDTAKQLFYLVALCDDQLNAGVLPEFMARCDQG